MPRVKFVTRAETMVYLLRTLSMAFFECSALDLFQVVVNFTLVLHRSGLPFMVYQEA